MNLESAIDGTQYLGKNIVGLLLVDWNTSGSYIKHSVDKPFHNFW
jgi:hypothetical protein